LQLHVPGLGDKWPVSVAVALCLASLASVVKASTDDLCCLGLDIGSWPTRISELEREQRQEGALVRCDMTWLAEHAKDARTTKRLLAA